MHSPKINLNYAIFHEPRSLNLFAEMWAMFTHIHSHYLIVVLFTPWVIIIFIWLWGWTIKSAPNSGTGSPLFVRFTLCTGFVFSQKKFTLCYFSLSSLCADFLCHFEEFFTKMLILNIWAIILWYNWFLRSIKTKSRFPTIVHKKIQICFTLCEFHLVRFFKKNPNSTKWGLPVSANMKKLRSFDH